MKVTKNLTIEDFIVENQNIQIELMENSLIRLEKLTNDIELIKWYLIVALAIIAAILFGLR